MSSICIADIELEQAYLNQLIQACAMAGISKDGDVVVNKTGLQLKHEINQSVAYIASGLVEKKFGFNPTRNLYFSVALHSEVFSFYWREVSASRYPSQFAARRFVAHLQEGQQQNTLLELFDQIQAAEPYLNPSYCQFIGLGLNELSELIVNNYREQEVKEIAANGGSIDLLEGMINELKAKRSDPERLQEKLNQLSSPNISTLDKAIIRRDVVRGLGIPVQDLDAIIESINLPPAPLVVRGSDFIKETAEGGGAWIYPGIIRKGATTLVVGIPGSMKSMWGLDVIVSYMNRQKFMGESPSELSRGNGRCLILNGDQTKNELREMLQKNPNFYRVADRFDVVNDFTVTSMDWLIKQLHKERYEFVFVDAYVSIHRTDPKFDENKDTAGLTIKAFNKLADDFGSAFIVIHHGKQDATAHGVRKSRGNQSISGSASTVITIDAPVPDKSGNVHDNLIRWVEVVKIRNESLFKQGIRFNPDNYHFDNIADGVAHTRRNEGSFADNLYNLHFSNDIEKWWTISELASNFVGEFSGNKEAYIERILGKLEQRSAIEKTINPNNPKDKKWRYKRNNVNSDLNGVVF
jgi:hypothetical protein